MAGASDPLTLRLSKGLRDLRASRERLFAVLAGVSEEQFKRRPPVYAVSAAGDWSIAEVLAHLLAAEQRLCARLEAQLAGEAPPPGAVTDGERHAEARLGRTVPVPQIIHGLLAARRRLEGALSAIEARWTAPAEPAQPKRPPYVAPDAIAALLQHEAIAHEQEHTAQIEAVKAVLPARLARS